MKLTNRHIFFIIALYIIFSCGLGVFNVTEGFENNQGIKAGSIVLITIDENKHVGTVSLVNSDGTYKVISYEGKTYDRINENNIINATSSDISEYTRKMTQPKTTANRDYIPQSLINGKKYSNFSGTNSTKSINNVYSGGIPRSKIPPDQEDLYILKSQVVPPVCPACPTIINNCTGKEKCPPCPPCGRCPEPSFECVKRPTYNPDNPYLPVPVLANFSSFGM